MHYTAIVSLVLVAVASAAPLSPDPAGAKNLGNGKGGQFITGQCLSNADCASGCCATLGNLGICSGPAVSNAQGKSGCGFTGKAPAKTQAPPPPPANNQGGAAAGGSGLKPDPAGEKNIGNGKGGQFITGQCLSNADCGSGCCATLGDIGICSGPAVSTAQGKSGCGFKGKAPAKSQATAPPATSQAASTGGSGLKPDPAGEKNIGNGSGKQFITGQCTSNADCGSGCCATLGDIGICSGPAVSTAQGKSGCGFKGKAPTKSQAPPPPADNAGAAPAAGSGLKPDPAGAKNLGNGKGGQFITGQCLSNADCASGCCATLGNIGICSGPAVSTAQGKSGCGFKSNKRSLGGVF